MPSQLLSNPIAELRYAANFYKVAGFRVEVHERQYLSVSDRSTHKPQLKALSTTPLWFTLTGFISAWCRSATDTQETVSTHPGDGRCSADQTVRKVNWSPEILQSEGDIRLCPAYGSTSLLMYTSSQASPFLP